jgi:hypothetical protein
MKKELIVNKVKFTYDIKELLTSLKSYVYDEPRQPNYVDENNYQCKSRKEFNDLKAKFKEKIEKLDLTISKLITANVNFTSKGLLALNRKNVMIDSNIVTNYSDEHGSHAIEKICVRAEVKDRDLAEIVVGEVKEQHPF